MLDICRICLATDVELQSLEDPLSNIHVELCDNDNDDYALYCPKCIYLLRKFHNFKNKCKRAHAILKRWKKQCKITRLPLNKLQSKLPNSLGLSNDNNHAIYSYNSKIENDDNDYIQNIDSLLSTNVESISDVDVCSSSKPGYVILDSTGPPFNKDATFTQTIESRIETIEKDDTDNSSDKLYIDLDLFSQKPKEESNKKERKTRNKTTNKKTKVRKKDTSNIDVDIFIHRPKIEKEAKDKKVTQKNKVHDELETVVKIEEFDDSASNLDELNIVTEELKVERSNDEENGYDSHIIDDVDDRLDDDEPVLKEDLNDQDNNEINNEVIKNYGGKDDDFDIEKLLKEALDSDSSDNEVLQKKRKRVISSRKKVNTKKKKESTKKRKSKDLEDELETDDESKPKRKKFKPVSKKDLEETQRYVKTRLGDGEVKDKKGNVIDVDSILNNLDKMHKYTYNKIKRYCAGNDPLSTEAIEFLARIQKRYGNQYSSIFITKHLTTDEEIIKEFRKRESNENYVQSEHKCTRCFRYFRFAKMLDYHIAEYHDPNKIHKCQYCDVGFNRVQGLRKHLLAHRVVYQCKLCPLVTNYTTVMETHFNIHKGVRYPCVKCDADFKSPPALAAHMNYVHQSDHICPCCSRNFHSEFGLHQHKMKKHPHDVNIVGPPSAKCEQCNIQFLNDEVYRNHMRKSHSDPKNIVAGVDMSKKRKPCTNRRTPRYTCRVCGGVESSMGALIWHFKTEHPHETFDRKGIALRAPYQYLCHECGKGFKMITSFTDHKNVHTGARPYTCTECPKAFHSRTHLRNHIAFHLPPTKECEQCGKKFHSKSNLSNHLRQHTGNRRYACEVCGKTFLHQGSVNAHVRGVHLHIRRTRKPAKHHDLYPE